MTTPVKIILSVVLAVVVLTTGVCVAGFFWVKNKAPQLLERGKKAAVEGETFGRDKEASACLDESLRRLSQCGGLMCETEIRFFMEGCFNTAKPSPQLCEGVPPTSEIIDTVRWSLAECEKRGLKDNQPCTRLIRALQDHCHR